jgi:KUP system potassium uptake protein
VTLQAGPASSRQAAVPAGGAGLRGGLTLAALGVVFGDIGTSPLYAVQTVFGAGATRPVPVDPVAVYGVASVIVWSVVLIVTLKYVGLIMRADNDGEGGIMALVSLLVRERVGARAPRRLVLLGILGAGLFFGDSLITPAISVLSAVEGLGLVQPSLARFVVPVAFAIIVMLFAIQRAGTAVVGRWFGPVMLVWFSAIGLFGLRGVAAHPGVLRGLSPVYAIDFLRSDGLTAFLSLGAVVLAVTGAEALYADLGHFGPGPIRRAWLIIVFPALVANYLGQAGLILGHPDAAANPFFRLVPASLLVPMVLLATAATVIASQAVISGAFSLARQATRLGYLPNLDIRHTSSHEPGQVYVPVLNRILMVGVLTLVVAFGGSAHLAAAYGVAVTGTMLITAVLFFVRAFRRAGNGRGLLMAAAVGILSVDLAFLAANSVKISSGGWLPLVVAAVVFATMANWQVGHQRIVALRRQREGPIRPYVEALRRPAHPLGRVPGTAVFLTRPGQTTPPALRAFVERVHALPEHVILVTVHVQDVPRVPVADQISVDALGPEDDGIVSVQVRLGFEDAQSIPSALRRASTIDDLEGPVDLANATYFVSTTNLVPGPARGIRRLRQRLYLATAALATDPVRYYDLPMTRSLTVGESVVLE